MDYFIVAKRDGVPAVPVPDMTGISGKRDEGVAVGAPWVGRGIPQGQPAMRRVGQERGNTPKSIRISELSCRKWLSCGKSMKKL
jgi:hypothetical protein